MGRRRRAPVHGPADELAIASGHYFDEAAADHAVRFFSSFLTHSKGRWAGKPFELLPWQRDEVVRPLYGWKRPDGTRRFREGYLEVPKKNGKSTLASGVSLYGLAGDNEPGPEVYCAAVDRAQAGIVYGEARNMAEASPALARHLKAVPHAKRIIYPKARGFLQALSADVASKEGLNASTSVVDELHAHKSRGMWDVLRYAGAARTQPLLLAITTAGFDRQSICYQVRTYAERVLSGRTEDPAFFARIFAAPPGADPEDPAVWRAANPSMGVTISEADFARELRAAQETPGALAVFLRYRLNIWTQAETYWLNRDRWDACGRAKIDPADLAGLPCHCGLDLSSTRDLTAFVELIGDQESGFIVVPHFWIPEATAAERSRRDRVDYLEWAAAGHLTLTPGDSVDYDRVIQDIDAIGRQRVIRRIYADPWNATATAGRLQSLGYNVEYIRQGFASMNAPTKELERLILARRIHHGGHPVLTWCADNVTTESDAAGNLKPSKAKSREKIDGIVALINALASAMDPDSELTGPSVYQTRGVLTLPR